MNHMLVPKTQTLIDRSMMKLAFAEREKSDDPKFRKSVQSGVGAVIAEKSTVISSSANTVPVRLKEIFERDRYEIAHADRYHVIEHAERAAIFIALLSGRSLSGTTIYCTRFPCSDCARAIIAVGISRVVVAEGYAGEGLWQEAQKAALGMMRSAGVKVRYLSEPDVAI